MYQICLQRCRLVILVSNYRNNIFGMQFAYGMDGALRIYLQRSSVVVDLWKKEGSVSIRHNYVKRSHRKYVIQSLQRHINRAKINTVNGRRVRQQNYKHNKLDITAREVWKRGQQAFLDIRVFWPQRLPLSEQVVATLSHNEQTRKKEHTMREFCKLNMVYLHHWFLQFMEVWGWNTLCFIQIYAIYCRRNMIY